MSILSRCVSKLRGRTSCELNTPRALFFRCPWSSILIMLKVLSLHVDHLSAHILFNATIQKELFLVTQDFSLCLLKTKALKDLGNIPCYRFLLLTICKHVLTCTWTPAIGTCSIWIIFSSGNKGVKSFSVNLNTLCCNCTSISLLNFINNSCLQSRACKASISCSVKQHLQIV